MGHCLLVHKHQVTYAEIVGLVLRTLRASTARLADCPGVYPLVMSKARPGAGLFLE